MIIALQTLIFFRESVLTVLERWLPRLGPLFRQLLLTFGRNGLVIKDEETEEMVFAEYTGDGGVMFFPPVYAQRYAAVCDCLMDERWYEKLEKIVNMGRHHDMNFIKYLTEVPGIKQILGVDIDCTLACASDLLDFTFDNYGRKWEKPLRVSLFQGSAADPDYRLIGCDAVVAIEMIEYMKPHDLDRLVHNIFGFIKPWIAIFTTTNADFNIVFKSLEKSGLRRLDHYFEWTREQLHDWCSNIVLRYPGYTVTCRGVGPGPPGTEHYGCCSQMVLFVAKDYHKQMELDVNSLALVADLPHPNQICDIDSDSEPRLTISSNNMLCGYPDVESSTDFPYPDYVSYCGTLSSTHSITTLCRDKASQCNLESELGKSFVMFDVEDMYEVMWPRKKNNGRVYEIGDVASSLNNTMFVVNKFSKTTQNLLGGEEINYLVSTRGVMDEVSHLTKMLNFTNALTQGEECNIWNNINWGDNAPYWNQYYKVVAVYNYPYEVKSEDNLILDLISEEINRLLDTRYDDDYSVHVSKLEIPIYKLMDTVKHVTEDVDRVIDLLEYNGYEIDGEVVIYSRLVIDDGSVTSRDEWPDNETYSDWDTTDVNSTISDGSNMPMDYDARSLRRALDRKVKKLRTMITHDEDITRELNQVVCRLLKIALNSSRGRRAPVQSKWLQCKLLDLLTLTEKAIVKRRARFIERYPLNAIGYGETQDDTTTSEMVELGKIKADDTALRIVEKYRHLVQASDNNVMIEDNYECYGENVLRSDFSTTISSVSTKNPDLTDFHGEHNTVTDSEVAHDNYIRESSILGNIECFPEFDVSSPRIYDDRVSKRIQSWVTNDQYSAETQDRLLSSGDDQSCPKSRTKKSKTKKLHRKQKLAAMKNRNTLVNAEIASFKIPKTNTYIRKTEIQLKRDHKVKNIKVLHTKKTMKPKSSYNNLVRKLSKGTGCELTRNSVSNYITNLVKPIDDTRDQTFVQLTASKPIPDSIIELCQPGIRAQKHYQELNLTVEGSTIDAVAAEPSIAATKESLLIGIVTEDEQETLAMRRTVGTDPGMDTELYEQELELTNVTSILNDDACYEKTPMAMATGIINSQTIFLYDINEPTTSKGLRHVSMDVQCGTDSYIPNYSSLSATTSLVAVPKMFTGIKIGDSLSDVRADNTSDFGTSTQDTDTNCAIISPTVKSIDIKIQDSDTQIGDSINNNKTKNECNCDTISKYVDENQTNFVSEDIVGIKIDVTNRQSSDISSCCITQPTKTFMEESIPNNMISTEMLKSVCSHLKIEDSSSEFNGSFCSVAKSASLGVRFAPELNNSRNMMPRFIMSKAVRSKLSCGGVHLHSYTDPQISEDVVYQGEWQQFRLRTAIRKKSCNSVFPKRNKDVASKKINGVPKDKLDPKKKPVVKSEKKIVRKAKLPLQIHHVTVTKMKDEIGNNMPVKKIAPTSVISTKPPWKPVRQVASKIGVSMPQRMTSRRTTQLTRRAKSVPPDLKLKEDKKEEIPPLKKYIPSYLSRMPKRAPGQKLEKNKFATNKNIVPHMLKINKQVKEPVVPLLNVEDIKAELLKIPNEPRENVSYVVFRNEIENSNSRTVLGETTVSARPSDRGNNVKGARSPGSPNCSTCSSPNSVATVKPAVWPKPFTSRRHSTPNNKTNVPRSGSENKISSRIKRFIKKTKVSKKESKKGIENKENVPESSANSKLKSKDADRVVSAGLVGASNTVYTAQVLSGSHSPNKSSIKMPFVKSSEDKNKPVLIEEKKAECSSQDANMVIVLEPCRIKSNIQLPPAASSLHEWIVGSSKKTEESNKNNILTAMKELIEESLDFIDNSDSFQNIDSETVILTPNRSITKSLYDTLNSPSASFKTVVNNKSETFLSAVGTVDTAEKNYNTSILSLTQSFNSSENTDLLSFKSVASGSKISDCFADNESYNDFNSISIDGNTVQDIYERKETILTQSDPGALAIQAFSGFSMNADPVAGDQPDYVHLIDSETGSVAYETVRLATSEEVFVSGRSSGSFASCVLDDDSVVPNWLFQIISQHHSQSFNALYPEENPVVQAEIPEPFAVDLDENSNEIGLAVGAGAGDGRGIHSDQSQDSSGRGTSLSSSASSSGAQSEAILIDPSAFIAHFDMIREPGHPSLSPCITPAPAALAANALDAPSTTHSHEYRTPRPAQHVLPGTSDVEADVSSTDTDVPSDN